MKVGGKRRLIVPSSFGYGEQGTGPIPGRSLLIFDVWLHDAK
jgi:FKBP-type peptidyl-prolyl cis-trans isomerase